MSMLSLWPEGTEVHIISNSRFSHVAKIIPSNNCKYMAHTS